MKQRIIGDDQLNHDSVTKEGQDMAALYALGALSQQEALAFDAHLREGCQVCSEEVAHFDQVVAMLGSSVEPVDPPEYVRDLLEARLGKEASEASTSGSVIPFPEKQSRTQSMPIEETPGMGRSLLPWAVAALLLIGLAYSFTAWRLERRSLQAALENERAQTASQASTFREELAKKTALSDELAQINSVLSSPRFRIIELAGEDPARISSARVYWDVQGNRWVVTADLPPPPQGKIYQLWFVTPSARISAGLIKPDKSGHGFSVGQFPPEAARLAAAAITLEPEGGSEQPTMPLVAVGKPV